MNFITFVLSNENKTAKNAYKGNRKNMTKKERYKNIISYFQENMPVAETELHYKDPFSLMVAVILSAQCTDKRVNMITPPLLRAFPNAKSMAVAGQSEIFEYVKSCSYPNNKAGHLKAMATMLIERYKGQVPSSVDELMKLPGVGRKTANVIASVAFNQPTMAVDTHVFRVSERIGLTSGAKTPLEAERQLVRNIPEDLIPRAHHWLILHGRYVCKARKPECNTCGLKPFCKYYLKKNADGTNLS